MVVKIDTRIVQYAYGVQVKYKLGCILDYAEISHYHVRTLDGQTFQFLTLFRIALFL